jgi:myo-inositol-1-phosphate synthase
MAATHTGKVRLGIVGIGNCASALIQGLAHYRDVRSNEPSPGLMTASVGGYQVGDVEIAAAFDISSRKVGRDVSQAIWADPNNTLRFADVRFAGVTVQRGPTLDGIGEYLRDDIDEADEPEVDVAEVLSRSGTDVLVSYLPVGSQRATEWYAERALEARCAFVNCIPVFIASNPAWGRRFEKAGLPLVGDDIKSQVGATILHRNLATLFTERGVRVDRTYQLNFGGNADFKNMLERQRLHSKKISKTRSVTSQLDDALRPEDVHIGPSDYVPWLTDRKCAYIRIEGTTFGGAPISAEVKLEVWDSPNSAGVVIDAVRCAKLAKDRGEGGPLIGPSSYFMKAPPIQFADGEARQRTLDFMSGTKGSTRLSSTWSATARIHL